MRKSEYLSTSKVVQMAVEEKSAVTSVGTA